LLCLAAAAANVGTSRRTGRRLGAPIVAALSILALAYWGAIFRYNPNWLLVTDTNEADVVSSRAEASRVGAVIVPQPYPL
jgi:hypothetical protein